MTYRKFGRSALGALGLCLLATSAAHAGAFGVREQSAYGQGSSYAGVAAGGSLSSMYWNAATMTDFAGMWSESVVSGIFPHVTNTATGGSLFNAGFGGTGNIGINSAVPSGYTSYQVTRDIWLGMATNAPFGLSEHFPDTFAGRTYAGDTSLKTYNFNPSVAWRVNEWLSLSAGFQAQYMSVNTVQGIGPVGPIVLPLIGPVFGGLSPNIGTLRGSGWGYGFTLGAMFKPMPGTSIGVGYRSAINQKINGSESLPAPVLALGNPLGTGGLGLPSTPGSINTTVNLPGMLSVGVRQQIGPQWTLLGTFEWTNWSRIGTATVTQPNGNPALVAGQPIAFAFQYRDGWFASGGAEYKWNDQWTLRGGVGFERTPISDQVRIPLLPDNDRTWVSVGATWNITSRLAVDLAYSHVFVKSTSINVVAGNPSFISGFPYTGTVDSRLDIISVGLKYSLDGLFAPAPAKLVTKG